MTDLLPALLAEHQPQSTLERHLTQQLAHTLTKQATAEQGETFLLDNGPKYLLTHRPDGHLVPDPAYLIYNNRLDAMRLHQARLGREQSRILRELHRLKRTPLVPKDASEPKRSAAAPKMSWVADIMADYDRKAAEAPSEPSKPPGRPANDPGGAALYANEPGKVQEANEPGDKGSSASEPTNAPPRAANEPTASVASPRLDRGFNGHGANAARPDPWMARSSRAKAEGAKVARLAERANEPNEPGGYKWPVLSDAEADRIEAMIHSGDAAQLEEAARLLGIMDPNAPVPPHILALARSKLAG